MDSGRIPRVRVAVAMAVGSLVWTPLIADAQEPDKGELAELVKQQSRQIKKLNKRIDKLEDEKAGAGQTKQQTADSSPQQAESSRQDKQTTAPTSDQPGADHDRPSQADTHREKTAAEQGGPAEGEQQQVAGSQDDRTLAERVDKLEDDKIDVDWSDGAPEIASPDGKNTFAIGGRVLFDYSSTFGSSYKGQDSGRHAGPSNRNINGSEFRQVRLDAHGKMAGFIPYKVEADFYGNDVSLRDAYVGFEHEWDGVGNGTLYLGNKFADRGLVARTPGKWTWFGERSVLATQIAPEVGPYSAGITEEFIGESEDWHASASVSKGTASNNGPEGGHSDNLTIMGRTHWNPIKTDDGMLHIGAHGSFERFHGEDHFKNKGPIAGHYNGNLRVASDIVDDPDTAHSYAAELAGKYKRFAFGGEWARRVISSKKSGHSSMDYSGWSGQVGYSLTGEQFGYTSKMGVFMPPKVNNPIQKGGIGAWQIMARYQGIDYQDSGRYHGGKGRAATVGLTWWLNDWVHTIFDYTRWHTDDHKGNRNGEYWLPDDGHTINARFEVTF